MSRSQAPYAGPELRPGRRPGAASRELPPADVGARRVTLVRVVLALGAGFVAVGLVWLVAANLDRVAPLVRFIVVVAIWLALTALAEVLAARVERAGDHRSPVVGALRLLAAASFAPVVFQAARSRQVPADEPALLGCAAGGALLYADAVRGLAPLVLAVGTLAVWFLWQVLDGADSMLAFGAAALTAAVAGAAMAGLHAARGRPEFALAWRGVGAAHGLLGLFVAAIPRSAQSSLAWGVVAVAAYLLLATAYAALGAVRDSPRLTVLATVAVVVFVAFQAFAVFAPILSGAGPCSSRWARSCSVAATSPTGAAGGSSPRWPRSVMGRHRGPGRPGRRPGARRPDAASAHRRHLGCPGPARRSAETAQVGPAGRLEHVELGERVVEVAAPLLEVGSAVVDLREDVLELAAPAARGVVQVDDRADLPQGEAQPLAPQDEAEPGPVTAVVDPRGAAALGGDEPEVLVVPDRAVGDPELVRDLGDGPGPPCRRAPGRAPPRRRAPGRGPRCRRAPGGLSAAGPRCVPGRPPLTCHVSDLGLR